MGPTRTAAQLIHLEDVKAVRLTSKEGEVRIVKPSDIIMAEPGDDGWCSLMGGEPNFEGKVEFLKVEPTVMAETTVSVKETVGAISQETIVSIPQESAFQFTDQQKERLKEVLKDASAKLHPLKQDAAGYCQQQREQGSVPEGFAARVQQVVYDRGTEYGTPAENHQLTADLWSSWVSRRMNQEIKFSAEDVCILNILQKESRLAFKSKDDSHFDVAGYTENVACLRPEQRNFKKE